MKDYQKFLYIETKDSKHVYRIDYNDLANSFKRNFKLNSNYEITFTLTYTEQYKDVYNAAKSKCGVWYNGQFYNIQSREPGINEYGLTTMKVTCTHDLIDRMKNIRIDDQQPTEDNPQITSNGASTGNPNNSQPQAGVVVKKTAEKQLVSLNDCLHKFIDNNDQSVNFELHGTFPSLAVECKGSLYDWLNQNAKTFNAYIILDWLTIKIYDYPSLKNKTGKSFRYMHNMTSADVQENVRDLVNDCWVYGGKMEKDITTVGGGDGGNGVNEPQNGDWTPVIQNAASLVGEHLSQGDINLILAQINLESSGREDAKGGDDGLSDGIAKGLLQFKQRTFDYYSRPPYTDIWHGLDQLVALMNVPNWRNQITGHSGWSPHGAPLSKDTIKQQAGGGWGWPFPSVGEGSFSQAQRFGYDGGYRQNSFHDGLDFGSIDHPGSEVHAVHGGTCTISRAWGGGGINWYCVIQDSSGLNVEYQEAFGSPSDIFVNVGQEVKTGDVIGRRTTDHLHIGITRHNVQEAFSHAFQNDGTWINPLETIKNGGAGGSSETSQSTSSTTTEVYYSLCFHYEDQESINTYGRHRGKQIIEDSIYDMDALKKYVENTVQHKPIITLSIDGAHGSDLKQGDAIRLIAPELKIDTEVTLVSIEGPDEDITGESENGINLTFNNTGLAMKDVNAAIQNDIGVINNNLNPLNIYGATGNRQENHFDNPSNKKNDSNDNEETYSQSQMDEIIAVTRGEKPKYNG